MKIKTKKFGKRRSFSFFGFGISWQFCRVQTRKLHKSSENTWTDGKGFFFSTGAGGCRHEDGMEHGSLLPFEELKRELNNGVDMSMGCKWWGDLEG